MDEEKKQEENTPPVDAGEQKITEQLYKQNLDLAVRNKTLTLLRELYQISIQTLEPKELSEKVSDIIQKTLEMELVVIYNYNASDDSLIPTNYSVSEKFTDSCSTVLSNKLSAPIIQNASRSPLLSNLFSRQEIISNGLIKLWAGIGEDDYKKIEELSNIKSSLIYPLIIKGRIVGIILMSLNRPYENFSEFEIESTNNIVNVVAVALDRAILDQELKEANEKLKELDKRKTEFVSIASHQLRSPLTAIKGYSSMLLEGSYGEINDDAKGAIDSIFQSSQRLVTVIEDFLNITRIELGKMKYEMSEFDIKNVAKQLVDDYSQTAKKKGLELSLDSTDTDSFLVYGDVGKITQVISNMVDNSIKYTPSGSIKLSVVRAGENIQVRVKDTGVGLKEDEINKLFQKFVRTDDAGKVNITGTGLGMYVAKQIVQSHDGQIWAESEGKGKGSTFVVEFPDKINKNHKKEVEAFAKEL